MAGRKGTVRRMKRGPPAGPSRSGNGDDESDGVAFPRSQDHFDRFTKLIGWELEDEMAGVEEELAREAFRLAAAKLPVLTTFVSRAIM